jgi:hypothetical protein
MSWDSIDVAVEKSRRAERRRREGKKQRRIKEAEAEHRAEHNYAEKTEECPLCRREDERDDGERVEEL